MSETGDDTSSLSTSVDYLIIGQGICGTFLSYYLLQAGKKVMVIDESNPFIASRVASGVINPVTGRRIVRTWRIEELLPFAVEAYKQLGQQLGVNLIRNCSMLDFHPTLQMKESFEKRLIEETEYLHEHENEKWKHYFNHYYGVGEISPCILIDINLMLSEWRAELLREQSLLDGVFDQQELQVYRDQVKYKNITAQKIIYCDGVAGTTNPFFKNLPYAPSKGEALIVSIPKLPSQHIYKHGLSIVPWKDGLFWVGSSYEWKFENHLPTNRFKQATTEQLKHRLKLPFYVVDHLASVRPANIERRPFVGLHPQESCVGIFNGMGTKGCSIAPFFAKQLTEHLIAGGKIYPDADVKRFEKVLAREMK